MNHIEHSETRHFVLLCGGAARRENPSLVSAIAGDRGLRYCFFVLFHPFLYFFDVLHCPTVSNYSFVSLSVSSYGSCKFLVRFFDVAFTFFHVSSTFLVSLSHVSWSFLLRLSKVSLFFHMSATCHPCVRYVSSTCLPCVFHVSSTCRPRVAYVSSYISFFVSSTYVSSTFLQRFCHVSSGVTSKFLLRFFHVSCTFLRDLFYVCFVRLLYVSCTFLERFCTFLLQFWQLSLSVFVGLFDVVVYVKMFFFEFFLRFIFSFVTTFKTFSLLFVLEIFLFFSFYP